MATLSIDDINSGIAAGSIVPDTLASTLEQLRKNAYSYLYSAQKDMVNISKFRTYYKYFNAVPDENVFTNNDFNRYFMYTVPKSFIHPNFRLKFRRSKYYDAPLTNDIINANRESLFVYNYLVFINGYLDTSSKIRCREDVTSICLRKESMDADLAAQFIIGATVDILFLHNSYFIDTSMVKSDLVSGNYTFKLNGVTIGNTGNKVMAFVYHDGGLKRCYDVKMDASENITIPEECGVYFNSNDTMNIKLLVMQNFSEEFDCDVSDTYFSHKETRMPIPSANTLMFNKNTDGSLFIDNGDNLTEKYPFVFQLPENRTVGCKILTFYRENPDNVELVYNSDMDFYIKLINVLGKYKDGSIPAVISGFVPYLYKYEALDYNNSDFSAEKYGPLMYEANKLNALLNTWGFAIQTYYENLHASTNGYILSLADKDLPSKLRKGNLGEITEEASQKTFATDRYLFTFKNNDPDNKLPYKFWIDGVRYTPDELYLDGTYEYLYIPTSLITQNSNIEIEKSTDNSFQTTVAVGNIATPLKFASDNQSCPFNSLFLTDTKGNYIPSGNYQVSALINGERIVLDPTSTMIVSNASQMQIQPLTDTAMNQTIVATCNDVPVEFRKSVTLNNYTTRNLNDSNGIHNIKPDKSRLRIFKRGLFLQPELYNITFPSNYNDNVVMDLNFDKYINDFTVDYLPEGYTEVYKSDTLDPSGIIYLEGIINKPFSVKYYDVYVNGKKLLPTQITKLANFTIAISDVNALRKVFIYEKAIGIESFQYTGATSPLLSDILLRTDPDFKKAILDYLTKLVDDPSIPDVDTMFDVIENFIIGLIDDYLEFAFVDPSTTVVPDAIVKKYESFFKSNVFFLDADVKYTSMDSTGHVYYLAPETPPEIRPINNPYYVKEFNNMVSAITGVFIDANSTDRNTDLSKYPTVKSRDAKTTLIDGDATAIRFASIPSKLVGTE